ncbi:g6f-like isoform X3 [Polypterus senegalus]|uniref:g6f-like isoform X3 n=1 Tax=Polypterus senegalus TaxID=55291 RepID=UPI001963E22E|nr:g6f-like isoform X3 [Polypterus senegalus]
MIFFGQGPVCLISSTKIVIILCLLVSCPSSSFKGLKWDTIIVGLVPSPVTLPCEDLSAVGTDRVKWLWKSSTRDSWSLVISARDEKIYTGGGGKVSLGFVHKEPLKSGNLSLVFNARFEDSGLYSCQVQSFESKAAQLKHLVLLVTLQVTSSPPNPIPIDSTLQLNATVSWPNVVAHTRWISPSGNALHVKNDLGITYYTRLTRISQQEAGHYVCQILLKTTATPLAFSHHISVSGTGVSPMRITYGDSQHHAVTAGSDVIIPCHTSGDLDYIFLYWEIPDSTAIELIFEVDLWRGTLNNSKGSNLRMAYADPTQSGNYSFLLTPALEDSGIYKCEVFTGNDVSTFNYRLTVVQEMLSTVPISLGALGGLLLLGCVAMWITWRYGICFSSQRFRHGRSVTRNVNDDNVYETIEDAMQKMTAKEEASSSVYMDLRPCDGEVYLDLSR